MASDGLDVRIAGVTSVLGRFVQLHTFSVGYFGISKLALVDNSRYHEDAAAPVKPNDLVEVSRSGFTSNDSAQQLVWKGRVTKILPGGLGNEGITWEVQGCNYLLNRWVAKWNGYANMAYNRSNLTQLGAPQFLSGNSPGTGSIVKSARWSVAEVVIDVLEHAFGINNPSRMGSGLANMPVTSDIVMHHPDPTSVTDPYASQYAAGLARDYMDQLVWDPAELKSLLDIYVPNLQFTNEGLWSVIEFLVQQGGNHGVFIDPTAHTAPRLRVHQFSNSTVVQIAAGLPGAHVESPGYRLISDEFEFDTEPVRNIIIVQGRPKTNRTDPSLPANDPRSGKLIKMDSAGKVWMIQNQNVRGWVAGWDVNDTNIDFRSLPVSSYENYGPVLYDGSSPKPTHAGANLIPVWLPGGVMLSKVALSGDLRVKTLYQEPFSIKVGPGPGACSQRPATGLGSVARYPNPTLLDAFTSPEYGNGTHQEMVLTVEELVHNSRQVRSAWSAVKAQPPPNPGKNDGTLVHSLMTTEGLKQDGYPEIADNSLTRDDTGVMVVYAEEIQRRFRDIRVKCRVVVDRINLSNLYSTGSVEIGLRNAVAITNLYGGRWSNINLQVMGVEVDVQNDRMSLDCTTDVYNANWRPPVIWQQRELTRHSLGQMQDLKNALIGGTRATARGTGEVQVDRQEAKMQSYPAPYGSWVAYTDPNSDPVP